MTLATLLAMPTERPKSGPGRPKTADDPAERAKHIECAGLVLIGDKPPKMVARYFGVSLRTVWLWSAKALQYPEADGLRRLVRRHP